MHFLRGHFVLTEPYNGTICTVQYVPSRINPASYTQISSAYWPANKQPFFLFFPIILTAYFKSKKNNQKESTCKNI